MQKRTPTLGHLAVIAAFGLSCFGLLLFLWLSFGGSVPLKARGYRVSVPFPQAGQLAQQADVRISGVSVGHVVSIALGADGRAHAMLELAPRYAPLRDDARAILRTKTLLGETYVDLSPGSRAAPAIREGGALPAAQVAPSVQLDEIYRTFDPRTRVAFQTWMQSLSAGLGNRGTDLNAALGELDPFSSDGAQLLALLDSQRGAVDALVRNTGVVFAALSQRQGQLRGLIQGLGRTFAATAAANAELADSFRVLPAFEQRSQTALRSLDSFAADANPLLDQLVPAEQQLRPTVTALHTLSPSLQKLLQGLGPLTTASKAGLPALGGVLGQLRAPLGALPQVLRQLTPLLNYLDGYTPELEAFFANTTAATEAFATPEIAGDQQVFHYLRTTNPLNPESLALLSRPSGFNRANAYPAAGAYGTLAGGLPVLDTRSCSNPTPAVSGPPNAIVSQEALNLIAQLGVAKLGAATAAVPTPPCRAQGAPAGGGVYPHVVANPR